MTNTADFTVAPVNTVMPQFAQTMALWVGIVLFLVYLVIGLRMSRKYGTLLPFVLVIAGFCTIIMEPIVILLGHCYHPEIGQWTMFKSNQRAIPWHVPFRYAVYYGAVYLAVFPKIVANSFTKGYVWKLFGIGMFLGYLFEIPMVSSGLWVYYDNQALWLWKATVPLGWMPLNILAVIMPITIIKYFYPILSKGWNQLLPIAICPATAVGTHVGVGFPFYSITNSSASQWLIDLSGIVTAAIACVVVAGLSHIIANNGPAGQVTQIN